jgi:hypothetical protein
MSYDNLMALIQLNAVDIKKLSIKYFFGWLLEDYNDDLIEPHILQSHLINLRVWRQQEKKPLVSNELMMKIYYGRSIRRKFHTGIDFNTMEANSIWRSLFRTNHRSNQQKSNDRGT